MEVRFESSIDKIAKEISKFERRQRQKAALHIKAAIKRKAHEMRITGNLEKGVYHRHTENASFVGIRAPAYHNYLIEYGHAIRKTRGGPEVGRVPAHPIVYPTFEAEADAAIAIMSEPVPL